MPEEEEKERGFKVADRRRFSAEGEAKPEAEEQPAAATAAKPIDKPAAALDRHDGPTEGAQAEASAAYQKAAASSQPGSQDDLGPQDLTFASFVVGLSTEALALMGEMPHPATGERMHDLVGAQQLIDIIAMLQDKTRGNLSHDEGALIDAILFDLRMKYVEKARPTPR
jgi:Domain of unknown function (DUF1844)